MRYEIAGEIPVVVPDAYVAPTAVLVGRASVAAEASVWFGAVIRADGDAISIGERSNVQDNVSMHADPGFPAIVGADVSIGHGAVVHGCTVHDRVLIGMNATVMNGAIIGSDTMIAAGALVSPGVVIPPRSLVVGVPGKVRRELTDAEVEKVTANAAGYVERARLYRVTGRITD